MLVGRAGCAAVRAFRLTAGLRRFLDSTPVCGEPSTQCFSPIQWGHSSVSRKASRPEPATNPQELREFLLELAIALNRHAVYPASHPSLRNAAAGVLDRVERLLRDRRSVSVGVARNQLIIEGVATDQSHPVLRSVAERLHRQHLGAVTISAGVTAAELSSMMKLVAVEGEQQARPLGLGDPSRLQSWEHIRLFALTYGGLELVGGEGEEGEASEESPASTLWLGLARAALAREDGATAPAVDSDAVAQAINEHEAVPAYDQVIVGYLLQLAAQLRSAGPESARPVRGRLSNLITRLDPATLQRLIEMGGDFAQRKKFLLDSTDALAVDSVLEVLKAAAETSEQTISNSMLRMLTKLSANASGGARGEASEEAMREQVRDLISGWSLEDPNPDAYTRALDSMSRASGDRRDAEEAAYPAEPLRLIRMALEVDVVGVPFWRAVQQVLAEHQIGELLDLLEDTPAPNAAADALWERLDAADNIRHLLTTDPVDFHTLDRLLHRMSDEMVASLLLDRISESSSRATRMGVLQRLSARGAVVLPQIAERLRDGRWYVLRNMLTLLNQIGECPPGVSPLKYATHERPTVRREALQLATLDKEDRERAICLAFGDVDEGTVRVGIRAAQDNLPASAVPLALHCLEVPAFSAELRAQLLRVLRPVRLPAVRDAMIDMVVPRRTLLGKPKLAQTTPDVLSALTALATTWRHDTRAAAVLERARETGNPDVLRAIHAGGRGK